MTLSGQVWRRGWVYLALTGAFGVQTGWAFESVRDQEIAQCLPGEIVTWADGQDRAAISSPLVFVYRHAGAPAWFEAPLVLSALQKAAQAWSLCGVASRVELSVSAGVLPAGAVLVQWGDVASRRNFGLANLGERTLSLGPGAFELLKARNPAHDARQTLQMVIAHEMGHVYGVMAHSKRCVDVTSYYSNGQGETCSIRGGVQRPPGVEYRSVLPTACDLERCRRVNNQPALGLNY
jgi:hypothetical protein